MSGGQEVVERMCERLAELRRDLALGEEQLLALTRQEAVLRQQLLRIGGAAQVLAELLAAAEEGGRCGEPSEAEVAGPQGVELPEQVVVG
jgi:hypothetical protein